MSTNCLFDGLLGGRETDSRTLLRVPAGDTWSYADIVDLSGKLASLLQAQGLWRPALYRPSLSASLRATQSGTNCRTSPPSLAASLTRLELT